MQIKRPSILQSKKRGLPPGSLVYIGNERTEQVEIDLFHYNPEACHEMLLTDFSECASYITDPDPTWVNISGIHDAAVMEAVGSAFGLHNLVLEDIMNTDHRPKTEEFDEHIFFTLKMLMYDETTDTVDREQVSFILTRSALISFQEHKGDVFEPIRERIRQGKGRVREKKTDYLVYLLIDIVIDNYFSIIEQVGNRVDELEEIALTDPPADFLSTLQNLKKQLIILRKSVFPLRESIGFIEKGESKFIKKDTLKYFRDVYDHTISVIDAIETSRETLSAVKDIYLSTMSNKMNHTMKVLTVMASIFIPLTFIAGIYGMNFDHMPELHYEYGYEMVWVAMILVTLGMVVYFRRKGWI